MSLFTTIKEKIRYKIILWKHAVFSTIVLMKPENAIANYMAAVGGWLAIEQICRALMIPYKVAYYYLNVSELSSSILKDVTSSPQTYKLI